jgi:hypothetical protein
MRAQLRRLLDMAELPNVTLLVIPFARSGQAGESGTFSILRFEQEDLPDVVYMEQLTSATYLDQRPEVETYLGVFNAISSHAETPEKTKAIIKRYLART